MSNIVFEFEYWIKFTGSTIHYFVFILLKKINKANFVDFIKIRELLTNIYIYMKIGKLNYSHCHICLKSLEIL